VNAKSFATNITPRQVELLKVLADFERSRCYSATMQELAEALGVRRSTVFEHIAALRQKGLVMPSRGRARSLRLTTEGEELLEKSREFGCAPDPAKAEGIPLAGRVAAGLPVEAVENIERLSLVSQFGGDDDIFALQVSGESMIEYDIRDGDYVICRRTSSAQNGQLVIAEVENEGATLKRFFKEPDGVRLAPGNPSFEPIFSRNCRIEAVVVGLLRRV
jgi:repressor LexA